MHTVRRQLVVAHERVPVGHDGVRVLRHQAVDVDVHAGDVLQRAVRGLPDHQRDMLERVQDGDAVLPERDRVGVVRAEFHHDDVRPERGLRFGRGQCGVRPAADHGVEPDRPTGERLEDPRLRAVGDRVADHERRRGIARAQAWQAEPPFHGVIARHDERLLIAGHAVHLDVAAIAQRERARRKGIQRRCPPFADEALRLAGPGADLDHDGLVGGAPEPHELLGWHAPVVTEQHQRAWRSHLAGQGTAGGPERRRRLRRWLRRGHARRDRTGDGAEREHGRERASHRNTVSSGRAEPDRAQCAGGVAHRSHLRLGPSPSGSAGDRSDPVDHADVVFETVARRVERVRRPSERSGHRPQRPSRHPSRPGRRRGTFAPGGLGRPTKLVLTHPMFVRPELWGSGPSRAHLLSSCCLPVIT